MKHLSIDRVLWADYNNIYLLFIAILLAELLYQTAS